MAEMGGGCGFGEFGRHCKLEDIIQIGPAHGIDEADDKGRHECPFHRSDTADDDDDEGRDDDLVAHADGRFRDR